MVIRTDDVLHYLIHVNIYLFVEFNVVILGIFVYSLYIAIVAILVLNLLIAVMNNSYTLILERESSERSRQRFRMIVDQPNLRGSYPKYVTFLIRDDHEIKKKLNRMVDPKTK
jgi:hypothetical protein